MLGFHVGFGQSYYYQYQNYGYKDQNGSNKFLNQEQDDAGIGEGWKIVLDSAKTDRYSKSIKIPFAFSFAGVPVSHIKVSSTGFVTFDTTVSGTPSSQAENLPSTKLPDKTVSVWGINGKGSNDQVLTKAFGFSPFFQFWVKFSSYSTPGDTTGSWNYWAIVLEALTNKMYVVSMNSNNATGKFVAPKMFAGVQENQATGINFAPILNTLPSTNSFKDNKYYEIYFGNQLSRDLAMISLTGPDFVKANENAEIHYQYFNFSKDTVDSLYYCYRMNGGPVTKSKSTLKLKPSGIGEVVNVTFVKCTAPVGSNNLLEVWVQEPSGQEDQNHANDTLKMNILSVGGTWAKSKLLVESNTAAWCGECPAADLKLAAFKTKFNDSLILVKYHTLDNMSGNGDSLVNQFFEKTNSSSLNREIDKLGNLKPLVTQNITDSIISKKLLAAKSPVNVFLSNVKIDTLTGDFTFKVKVKFVDYCPANINVGGIAIENAVRGVGTGWDQVLAGSLSSNINSPFYAKANPLKSYYHDDVAWNLTGGIMGKKIAHNGVYKPGDSLEVSFAYKYPKILQTTIVSTSPYSPVGKIYSYGKPRDMKAVGYVSIENGNEMSYKILNANEQQTWDFAASVKKQITSKLTVYPNPTEGVFYAEVENGNYQINLFSVSGAKLMDENATAHFGVLKIDAANLNRGLYFVQIIAKSGLKFNSKIVVK